MVEYKLPKLGVAGSNPVARSSKIFESKSGLLPSLRLSTLLTMVGLLRIADLVLVFHIPLGGLCNKSCNILVCRDEAGLKARFFCPPLKETVCLLIEVRANDRCATARCRSGAEKIGFLMITLK